ncbi:MAG: hypothetical protein AAF242_19980 [Bacteroidota bacterium]
MSINVPTFTSILIILVLALPKLNAQSNWKLIYENDSKGNTVEGQLADLIQAIRDGEEIRIYWNSKAPGKEVIFVEHTTDAKFTTIMNSPAGQFVTAQIDPIMGQTPSFDEEQVILKENLQWTLIAHSNGKHRTRDVQQD